MQYLLHYVVGIFVAAGLLAPFSVAAVGFFPFGGRVISENFCANGGIQVLIKPAGIFPSVAFMWTPLTRTLRGPFIPSPATPPGIGQVVMGTDAPVPVSCVGFGTHPPLFVGFPMLAEATGLNI